VAPGPSFRDVPGWLAGADELLFEWLLTLQSRSGSRGDVVELGAYQGRSAIHIGRFVESDERFVVCDLFEDTQGDESVPAYVKSAYSSLTQASFERNYLQFHRDLPTIVRGLTSEITEHAEPGSCRFVHIDASHAYADVRADTMAARTLLGDDGIVVFDDFRNAKTVGTAAAAWEAVAVDDLIPICVSDAKLYATWGDAMPPQHEIAECLKRNASFHAETTLIRGRLVLRVAPTELPAAAFKQPAAHIAAGGSRTTRIIAATGRLMSSAGFRLSRLAKADDPLGAARQASARRANLLRGRIARATRRES
jgi:predicted O-methyltransferase YrrM